MPFSNQLITARSEDGGLGDEIPQAGHRAAALKKPRSGMCSLAANANGVCDPDVVFKSNPFQGQYKLLSTQQTGLPRQSRLLVRSPYSLTVSSTLFQGCRPEPA